MCTVAMISGRDAVAGRRSLAPSLMLAGTLKVMGWRPPTMFSYLLTPLMASVSVMVTSTSCGAAARGVRLPRPKPVAS